MIIRLHLPDTIHSTAHLQHNDVAFHKSSSEAKRGLPPTGIAAAHAVKCKRVGTQNVYLLTT